MHSPVRALLWEQWRHIRWPMLAAFLFMMTVAAADWMLNVRGSWDTPTELYQFTFIPVMLLFIIFVFVSQGDLNDLHVRFAPRLFALPVRISVLVNCVLLARLAAIWLLAVVTQGSACLLFRHVEPALFDHWFLAVFVVPLFFAVITACFQSVLWWPGLHVLLRVGVILGVYVAFILIGKHGLFEVNLLLFALLALLAYSGTMVGVMHARRGGQAHRPKWVESKLQHRTGRAKPFASAASAQVWFEWKTKGRYLPLAAGVLLPLVVGGFVWYVGDGGRSATRTLATAPIWVVMGLAYCAPMGAAILGMLMPAIDYRHHASGFSTFAMTRPMHTRALGAARLKMGALSIVATYALMALILCFMAGVPTFLGTLKFISTELEIGAHTVAFAHLGIIVYAAICWILLWLGLPFAAGSVVAAVISETLSLSPSVRWWSLSAVVACLTVFTFLAAYRHKLVSSVAVCVLAVAWAFMGAAIIIYAKALGIPIGSGDDWAVRGIAAAMALALLPLLPFATVPLTIHWFRHR